METKEAKLFQRINQIMEDKFNPMGIKITDIRIIKTEYPNNYEITVYSGELSNTYRFSEPARMFLQEYFQTSDEHYLDLVMQEFQKYL